MPSWRYLDLSDFLVIAETVLGTDATVLTKTTSLLLADLALNAPAAEFQGVEFYPEFHRKAAVLCHRLVNNHPLLDGNKRTAFLCVVEFCERNGYEWTPPVRDDPDGDETVDVVVRVAAGECTVEALATWIEQRISRP